MPKVVGQDEILNAYHNGFIYKLWDLVKYIGFNKIKSPEERKLVFLQTCKNFNEEENDNFVHFYNNNLHFAMLNKYAETANPLTKDRRANKNQKKKVEDPSLDDKVINQNENILEHFIF